MKPGLHRGLVSLVLIYVALGLIAWFFRRSTKPLEQPAADVLDTRDADMDRLREYDAWLRAAETDATDDPVKVDGVRRRRNALARKLGVALQPERRTTVEFEW